MAKVVESGVMEEPVVEWLGELGEVGARGFAALVG